MENESDNKIKKYNLKRFYLIAWGILSVLMCSVYILAGMKNGIIGIPLEIIFAGMFATFPTLIYFFFKH